MKYVSSDDFKNDKGYVDWGAYDKAQKANGEKCDRCGNFISFPSGHPDTCSQCRAIYEKGDLYHTKSVRCPQCHHVMNVYNSELFFLYDPDNEEKVFCDMCDYKFFVQTRVQYTFISPSLIEEAEINEEDEEDEEDED